MSKAQIILIISAVAATLLLFFAGSTVAPEKRDGHAHSDSAAASQFDIQAIEKQVLASLSAERQQYLEGLAAGVVRGDVAMQEIDALRAKAHFFHDSAGVPPLHFYYLSKAAELEGNEKSLTFAAHSILAYLPFAENSDEQQWLAGVGKKLFDKALVINPNNDSTIIGAGACYMFGAGGAEGPMKGIMKVREVAERDSSNTYAQYMLGMGGIMSGQIDKAIERFEKVVAAEPENIEVMFRLAELNERVKNNAEAVRWYQLIKSKIDRPDLLAEIDNRIKSLQ